MKLCRFELKSEPGRTRSGMVFSGKVYETDGAQAIGVHEAVDVRPLAPIRLAPSLRVFRSDLQGTEPDEPRFFYGNPTTLVGPSTIINHPGELLQVTFKPFLAAILVSDAYKIDTQEADEIILGITLLNLLVIKDLERRELRDMLTISASHDLGGAIGPVVTTPEELDDQVLDEQFGRRYKLSTVARVNGVERARGDFANMPFTFAQAISSASQTCVLREGDVFALGPIVEFDEGPIHLAPDDEVQLAVDKLGALSLRIATEI